MKFTKRRAAAATAGVVVAGGLVFGATQAFAASPATTSTASTSSTASTKAEPCKQAAHPRACRAGREAARDRLALFKHGAHGQATVKNASGALVVREWQVGKVTAVNGDSVTVTDSSNTTWTWTVQSGAKIHVDGSVGALSGVHTGDTILVRGTQSGSANDATKLFDPNQSKLQAKLG